MAGAITIHTRYLPPANPSSRALAIQVIELVDSYMIWAGATDVVAEDVDKATLQGRLCKDWACALPGKTEGTVVGTSLFRSARTDAALSMAQRLARRFGKPVYVSLDVDEEMIMSAERGIITAIAS